MLFDLCPQTYPHHEFSSEELALTLQTLGLCPSVSLVVRKHAGPVKPVSPDPHPESVGGGFPKRPRTDRPSGGQYVDAGGRGHDASGRGHRLGGSEDDPPEPMDLERNEDQQHDEAHSDSDDSDSNNGDGNYNILPHPQPPMKFPRGNFGLPPPPAHRGGRGRRVNFGRGAPPAGVFGQDDLFGGGGNRLGGKSTGMKFGDPQMQAGRVICE